MGSWRRRLAVLTAVLACSGLGVFVATTSWSTAAGSAGPGRSLPGVRLLSARRIRPQPGALRPGTKVGQKGIGERIYSNGRDGFALAQETSTLYPVSTVNGGRSWRIDGPWLYREAADAPAVVGDTGLVLPRTFYAYGPSVIDVTPNGGRVWWQTFIPNGLLVAVVPSPKGHVLALVQQTRRHHRLLTLQYVSRDGGRHWRYSTALYGGT